MLARLGKTLSTNAAIGGLALLVVGAGGTAATLAAGSSPAPTPNSHANSNATQHPDDATDTEDATDEATEAPEAPETDSQDSGTRPTDTHGYCVSQVAQAPTTSTDPGAHGAAVSAAAHACGKGGAASSQASAHRQNGKHGKAFGKNHGTGRPAGVTPGAPAQP